jgi:hypothetical protein
VRARAGSVPLTNESGPGREAQNHPDHQNWKYRWRSKSGVCAQDLEWSVPELELKLRIQGALANMSVPNRTMLRDSKVYATMERWAVASPWDPPHPPSR